MIPTAALRAECEQYLKEMGFVQQTASHRDVVVCIGSLDEHTDALLHFIQAREAAVWREVIDNLVLRGELRKKLYPAIEDPVIAATMKIYQDEADSIIEWCEAHTTPGEETT